VRDLVRSLRPGARDANMTPPQACASLSSLFARHPETKQHFLSEGGVLSAMELLDADTTKTLEPGARRATGAGQAARRARGHGMGTTEWRRAPGLAHGLRAGRPAAVGAPPTGAHLLLVAPAPARQRWWGTRCCWMAAYLWGVRPAPDPPPCPSSRPPPLPPAVDLVCAFVAGDTRLLESLCLVGIVPAMCRMALPAPPGAERLRSRAAGFLQQLCFSGVTTLQMLIACGGLRCEACAAGRALAGPGRLFVESTPRRP
jgi:hypothetical protein